ncbi:MAG TPA: phospholipase [Catenuloplanes sp.]|jgi:hypothetical protein
MTGHDHDGQHQHPHPHPQHNLGPSGTGTAVLDIGGDVGALVLWTGAEYLGWEIEISPEGAHRPPRTHAAVRERQLRDGVRYSALYVGLPEGRYVIWRDETTQLGRVTITGGKITEYDWLTD